MRKDWEAAPTVDGIIIRAWINEDGVPDVIHVQSADVADDTGNLDRVIGNPDNPDPDRPFVLMGKSGVARNHGYTDPEKIIGKRCLIWSGGRFDYVAIEPETEGCGWVLVPWKEYTGLGDS